MSSHSSLLRMALPLSALAMAGGTIALTPSAASAHTIDMTRPVATAGSDGPLFRYTAAPGQANHLTVTMSALESEDEKLYHTYTLDDVYPIASGPGCTHPDENDRTLVVCRHETADTRDPSTIGKFVLSDQNDTVKFYNLSQWGYFNNEFWLGSGNDHAVTRQANGDVDGSAVWGQNGNDVLVTGHIDDIGGVRGGNGNDVIRVNGGTWAEGGNGKDKLYATGASNAALAGGKENDLIKGGGGPDILEGGTGDDVIYGRGGADQIWGNSGNDRLHGGPGNDTIRGGAGKDVIHQN